MQTVLPSTLPIRNIVVGIILSKQAKRTQVDITILHQVIHHDCVADSVTPFAALLIRYENLEALKACAWVICCLQERIWAGSSLVVNLVALFD